MTSALAPAMPPDLELRCTLAEQFNKTLAGRRVSSFTARAMLEAAYHRAQIGACVAFRIAGSVILLDGGRDTADPAPIA